MLLDIIIAFCLLSVGVRAAPEISNFTNFNFTHKEVVKNVKGATPTYTQSLLSELWSGMTIQTAAVRTVVEPTPLPKEELIEPPNLPSFESTKKLPKDFMWGWSATGPQIEGAVKADNRGPSVWDTISHKVEGFIQGPVNLDIAANHYYLYKQDITRMAALGIPYYSLSISWPRIFPFGNGTVNQAGLDFYKSLIDFMATKNIQPIVTLYHWDIPQALQNSYGGFLSEQIVADFGNYVRTVFNALGHQVKIWITMNEPQIFCGQYKSWPESGVPDTVFPVHGVADGLERKYLCGHNALLAHANAVKIFREEIEPKYGKGKISFANSWDFTPPLTSAREDRDASKRSLEFSAAWFGYPVYVTGDYPVSMRESLGDLLPRFTAEQRKMIKGSTDFYAWDAYTGYPVTGSKNEDGYYDYYDCVRNKDHPAWPECAEPTMIVPGGWLVGNEAQDDWLHDTPDLFRQGVVWSWKTFKPPAYFIPEFGFSDWGESNRTIAQARIDNQRTSYLQGYLNAILELVNTDKVNLIGAMGWSMMDNVEWQEGVYSRFGFQYVDFWSLRRYFKKSAFYFRNFFKHYTS